MGWDALAYLMGPPACAQATPVLWGEASGSDGLSSELELGFGEGAPSGCLDTGSPFPCMASILEKQIAEAEQLFPGAGCALRCLFTTHCSPPEVNQEVTLQMHRR